MKKILLGALLLFSTNFLNAQPTDNVFQFDYDAGGNRIKRLLIPGHLRHANPNQPEQYTQQSNANLISVFPNPSRGIMQVKIDNLKDDQNASVKVYTTNGSFVKVYENVRDLTTINIEDKPTGNYILSVAIDKKVTEWIVMKEE